MPEKQLQDKVIIVTGGTGVLGYDFNKALAAAGAVVGILGRNKTVAEQRAKEINDNGGRAIALAADVLKEYELVAAKEKIITTFGKIDGLVNAAGGNIPEAVVPPASGVFELNIDALRKVMDLNLFGTLLPTQIFGPAIAANAT
ncbi:MAG: SDR family NAD(P)-dependent oxidoreductase, partial [Chitinophagaceae bacterium]